MKKIMFWFCFSWGTVLLICEILLAGASAKDSRVDAVIFAVMGLFLVASLILARFYDTTRGRLIMTLIPGAELMMCMIGLIENLFHRS